ncbi:hypothetical protein EB796_004559 [Bugula neritina]|uniref:Uncharacterized protein n=1 Tax=Bugula neritina TaxID=10212 RepID=A0A7J7KGZ3_BUGNE|nr:hypothetical protein EB796_004559 [Bugula neritina]
MFHNRHRSRESYDRSRESYDRSRESYDRDKSSHHAAAQGHLTGNTINRVPVHQRVFVIVGSVILYIVPQHIICPATLCSSI